ncbi:MAG: hypothetical protein WBL63_19375 [Candidatus Acidiferrum sp.]
MTKQVHRLCVTVVLILVAADRLPGPASSQTFETRPPLPIDDWLRGPDRQDFAWKIHLLEPRLTFQQRYLVQVRATIDAGILRNVAPPADMHFVVKVSDDRGHWLTGDNYNHFPVPPGLGSDKEIAFDSGLYLRPGNYTIAVIAYDSVRSNGNLWRRPLRVRPLKDDPLPQLDRDLPQVEFLREFPTDSLTLNAANEFPTARPVPYFGSSNDETWPLGHGREWLPVSTARPVRIDLIMDFSGWTDPQEKIRPSAQAYRQSVGRLLQVGSVISHLTPKRGCIRVSSLDMLRMRTILDRVDSGDLDWDIVQRSMTKLDQFTVDVRALEKRKQAAEFFRRFVTLAASDSAGCGSDLEVPLHVVIVAVAGRLQFPSGTRVERMEVEADGECHFYYLRPEEIGPGYGFDDVERMLKSVGARQYALSGPREFRRVLAKMIVDVEAASASSAPQREP